MNASNADNLRWKMTSRPSTKDEVKILKLNISTTTILHTFEVYFEVLNENYISNHSKYMPRYIKILNPSTRTQFSLGKFKGKPRGNPECGSSQPSLFILSFFAIQNWTCKVYNIKNVSWPRDALLYFLKYYIFIYNIRKPTNK